ncbi:MBL fold metallo-hydrolase [Corynebacterium accolens]|uniref:MBL fold metallo-hydrolase n=1 Tax=Corynebacterium accolens TaxID=38284 RepID=UPI00242FD159|nr:MBL fold metallo-hydrolase [Corynebacterium accolens]MDK4276209.1 MBL fold metallo-hydrolase [Corynebacterium accolens]
MEFSLLGHACVAVEAPGGRILIDPGTMTPTIPDADAVLITHAHADHLDPDRLPDAPLWGPAEVCEKLGRGTAVTPGETITVAGQDIKVLGGRHALIHPNIPRPVNVGYLLGGLLHPGDQYIDHSAEVLLLPIAGPWVKAAEAADYAQRVGAAATVPIHDAVLSDVGRTAFDTMLTNAGVPGYRRLAQGKKFTA